MTAEGIAAALVAVAQGNEATALDRLNALGGDRLARALADGLASERASGVYVDPEAFTRFIDSKANARLYRDVGVALGDWVEAGGSAVRRVVDVGCGDGRVTRSVLPAGLERVELVEPSGALLELAAARLEDCSVERFEMGVADWLVSADPGWRDVGWSTFALHNLPVEERGAALRGIASRVNRFAVVEFDVPTWRSVEQWAAYCAERYIAGAAAHDDELVLSGFLVPVLLGQFASGASRHTYEQPLEAWRSDFEAAGFTHTEVRVVHSEFWWGPAGLVLGNNTRRGVVS